jgi:membrane protease subunit HflK
VIPRATGSASRLKEEAQAYKDRIVAQAEGDAQRFKTILPEYQKAPQVTRDRMYIDTMQQIYSSVSKVVVDSKQGSNLLYLPLDKIMQQVSAGTSANGSAPAVAAPVPSVELPPAMSSDTRSRDNARSRDVR